MRAVCTQALQQADFIVHAEGTAASGYQALEQALVADEPFDGLLLDWVLPDMSGADLLRKIAAESRFDPLSVMIFTERPDETAYQLASVRPNNDIQHKEDLTLLPYRMRKFLTTYNEQVGIGDWIIREQQQDETVGGDILFVDDSLTVCAKYSDLLRSNGYQVTTAHSMAEALEIAQQKVFQLAVVDHYMPNGNGDELCRALLTNPATAYMTVVMHSQSREVLEQALDAGAIDLIWKDDPVNIFLMRISSILRTLRLQKQSQQLDVLQAAAETLNIGLILKGPNGHEASNSTMEQFAEACGGLSPFILEQSSYTMYRIEDQQGKEHAFNIHAIEGGKGEEVVLVQDVTAMADALDQAESANTAKDNFLASFSHELRTPLTAIIGNSEILAENELNQEQLQLLHSVEVSGRGLLSLINDILDLSKIAAEKFEIDEAPYSLTALIRDVEHIFSIRAQDAGLEFSTEFLSLPAYQPLGDGRRVTQILINLLGNAIKFTREGFVKLRVWSDQSLHFQIEDSGIGMDSDVLSRLFKPFEQADSTISQRFGGTGLGLHISWSLAERMGGTIEVKSEAGSGSSFELTIPYRPSTLPEVLQQPNPVEQRTQTKQQFEGKVLVAEDTRYLQLLERKLLESLGCTVAIANNGQEALEMATQQHFDLILMDMQMPIMGGIEATEQLRGQGNQVPIVALTANVMQKHRDQFTEAGCDDFLAKPIDKQTLQRTLSRFLRPHIEQPDEGEADTIVDEEMMKLFIEWIEEDRNHLVEAHQSDNWEAVQTIAHTIKGTAITFGFPKLSTLGRQIQDLPEGTPHQQRALLTESFINALNTILSKS